MRTCLLMLVLATPALALAQSSDPLASCGPDNTFFKVTLDKTQHTALPVDPGKARVYFVQDSGTTKVGMDGAWVGANDKSSWFSVPIEPGEHHICTSYNSASIMRQPAGSYELTKFTAEAGKSYYFRIRIFWEYNGNTYVPLIQIGMTNSDQALLMISSYPLSVSTPTVQKKFRYSQRP